jgi:putative transposase
MVEADHTELSIAQQCAILDISRSAYYYKPKEVQEDPDLIILEAILEALKEKPFYGYRRMAKDLAYLNVTRKQIRRIMKKAGLRAIYPGLQLSKPAKGSKKYPYLLRGMNIWLPNQVWATDITYIKLSGGYVYLVAIIDLYSRKVLSWQVSNTMDAQFCVSALEEAIARYGVPGIFNTDQGSQFTSDAFISVLEFHGIRISMDGVNRALDNIRVERFWRSLKYEDIYLKDYRTMIELKEGLSRYMKFYNSERFHQSLEYETPDTIYGSKFQKKELKAAA